MFCHCTVVFCNVNLQLLYCTLSHDEAIGVKEVRCHFSAAERRFVKPCISLTKPFVFISLLFQAVSSHSQPSGSVAFVQSVTSCTCLVATTLTSASFEIVWFCFVSFMHSQGPAKATSFSLSSNVKLMAPATTYDETLLYVHRYKFIYEYI